MSLISKQRRSLVLDSCFISLFFAVLFFLLLGSRPLFVPDEGRYAEIAREMITGGDFITPYLNGIKYFEKPVLFYWLTSLAIKLFGLNLWALRSVNAILAIFGCLATYLSIRKIFDRTTALLSAFILGTSFLYVVMGRMLTLDLSVTVFITCSLYAFLLGNYQGNSKQQAKFYYLSAVFAGCAVLTKGLIGILFPGMIITAWCLLTRRRINLKICFISCIIFLLVVLPWHLLVQWHNPEFFDFYIVEQHFLRYLSEDVGHYQPFWFFIPCLILGFFPWIIFLPQALYHAIFKGNLLHKSKELFFLLWAVLIFVFFSYSKSKLIPYILPVFPPLAVMTSIYLARNIKAATLSFKIAQFAGFLFAFGLAIGFTSFLNNSSFPDPVLAKIYLHSAMWALVIGTSLSLIFAFVKAKYSTVTMIFYSSLFSLLVFAALPAIDNRSIYPLANLLKTRITDLDEVITYDRYYQDLPFYLQRKVMVLNWRNELTFGMQHQKQHDWLIDDQGFWQLWHSRKQVYVVLGRDDYQKILELYPWEKFVLIGQTHSNILATNR